MMMMKAHRPRCVFIGDLLIVTVGKVVIYQSVSLNGLDCVFSLMVIERIKEDYDCCSGSFIWIFVFGLCSLPAFLDNWVKSYTPDSLTFFSFTNLFSNIL